MIIKTETILINTDNITHIFIKHFPKRLICGVEPNPLIISSECHDNEKLLNDIYIAMASGVKYAEIIDGELIPFEGEESANERRCCNE